MHNAPLCSKRFRLIFEKEAVLEAFDVLISYIKFMLYKETRECYAKTPKSFRGTQFE
jgi:hypothetical protein